MHTNVNELFAKLWENYLTVTPSARKIHALLGSSQQDDVINDHIALRTFNLPQIGLDKLAAHFLALGYVESGEYHFEAKKLYAKHFEHPDPKHLSSVVRRKRGCRLDRSLGFSRQPLYRFSQ